MVKHIARHNNKKVVILYRKVPGEDHMCLVVYSDVLSKDIHDSIMATLESPMGQNAKEFADALFRVTSADGRNVLEVCHKEGFIKKIQTSQVLVTPTATSTIRLDELNKMLDEMAMGEDAIQRMKDLDNRQGLSAEAKLLEGKTTSASVTGGAPVGTSGVLSDADIANQQLSQAARMKSEAAGLINEANRLEAEAKQLLEPNLINDASKIATTTQS